MVLITNINHSIEEPTHGCRISKTNQILVFGTHLVIGGYVKVRESLYTRDIIGSTIIPKHISTRVDST